MRSVAVFEGMNELELVVKDRTRDQRMLVRAAQPGEEIRHEVRNAISGRADVVYLSSTGHGDANTPGSGRGSSSSGPP